VGWFWAQAWASVRPLHGLHGQVSVPPIFLFCFYFPVLYLSIEIHIWVWFSFADLSIMQIFNQDLVSCLSYQYSIGTIILDEIILHISDLFKITI
jgi:hypothetical protein